MRYLSQLWQDESGQDLVEYSLIMACIVIACMAFIGGGRSAMSGIWSGGYNQLVAANSIAVGS
jgi:Flp pilus assembly pilin Flp